MTIVFLPLTRNKTAVIDFDDFEKVRGMKFYAQSCQNLWYAAKNKHVNGKRKLLYLHRIIMGAKPGQLIDHINGDGLDNRRENLRVVTHAQNVKNWRKHAPASSRYKGVRFHANSWEVQINVNRKRIYIGRFQNEIDAAKAYDESARRYFGEFAAINFLT